MMSVFYEELAPKEFSERIKDCPVGYLPLGTIEWHGPQNPLGVDILQARELFALAAGQFGGIVFPPLFLGPDRHMEMDGTEYTGMDVYFTALKCPPYPLQQFPGSCYWVSDETYRIILDAVFRQAARAGFKVLMGTGHGPSRLLFESMAAEAQKKYGLTLLSPYMGKRKIGFAGDHAAKSETSNMLYFRPELVHMDRLDPDPEKFPPGVSGPDPRTEASAEYTASILPDTLTQIGELIGESLGRRSES